MQEARGEVSSEPAHADIGEVDVRDDERPTGRLERYVRKRLVCRNGRGSVTTTPLSAERVHERLAERPTRGCDLRFGVLRSEFQNEIERGVLGKERQQMVEDGHAGADVCPAASMHVYTRLEPACLPCFSRGRHPPKQGIAVFKSYRYEPRAVIARSMRL